MFLSLRYRTFITLVGVPLVSLAAQLPSTIRAADWTADQLAVPFPAPSSEAELMEALQSDAPPAEKALACKQLAIYGSKKCVPELAKLLSDEQLASWARIALEAIPDSAADKALIAAAKELDGKLLVGVINSIGVRRSANAVEPLAARLLDQEKRVASAAAIALGRIGGEDAVHALRAAFPGAPPAVQSAIAEGGILCAEQFLAEGNSELAAKIYDTIRQADLPQQRIVEASRGAVLARGAEGIPLLVELLKSSDNSLFQIALGTAREMPGQEVDEALANELAGTSPERAALIVYAIGDRGEALPAAVLKAARQGEPEVRMAAIDVVGTLGGAESIDALLNIASESDTQLSQAAKDALARLSDDGVDAALVGRVSGAEGKTLAVLFAAIGQRRIHATKQLMSAVEHADESVRRAAISALGATATAEDLDVLIDAATEAKSDADAQAAWQALEAASVRMPDREATAARLADSMRRAEPRAKARVLQILGTMGGKKALQAIAAAAQSADPQLQDAATRELGKWMTPDAAPHLYRVAADENHKYKIRALRGYLRIARQLNMPDSERLEMCRKALAIAERTEERDLALDAMKRCPSPEAVELASSLLNDDELRERAVETAVFIGEKIKDTDPAAAKSAGQKALDAKASGELADRARALAKP